MKSILLWVQRTFLRLEPVEKGALFSKIESETGRLENAVKGLERDVRQSRKDMNAILDDTLKAVEGRK